MVNSLNYKGYPLISKEEFVAYMNLIKSTSERECLLQDAFEKIDPECDMAFLSLYSRERAAILDMLVKIMCCREDDYYGNYLEYFMCDLDWGTNKLNPTNNPDLPKDFDSLESLYDYLVADYHAQLCEGK